MKAVIIGSCGHYMYIWKGMKKYDIELSAVTEGVACGNFTPEIYKDTESLVSALETGKTSADIAVINAEFHKNSGYAERLLRLGMHIFLEKPAATELDRLASLRIEYEKAVSANPGLQICPMFGMRAEPHFMTAKRIISEGGIGKIRQIDARKSYKMGTRPKFYSEREKYGGLIPWVAIHGIDLIRWISDAEFTSVNAWHSSEYNRGNGDMEVSSISLFRMTNDIGAVVSADMLRPEKAPTHDDDRIRVVGSEGIIEVCEHKVLLIDAAGAKQIEPAPEDLCGDIFSRMIEYIGESSAEKRKNISRSFDFVSAEDIFSATEAALLARLSADNGISVNFRDTV